MKYELAAKLRDAGFPQKSPRFYESGWEFDEMGMSHPINSSPEIYGTELAKTVYYPSLSELIGECGNHFFSLTKRSRWSPPPIAWPNEWRSVGSTGPTNNPDYHPGFLIDGFGDDPEEAVASLYLATKDK